MIAALSTIDKAKRASTGVGLKSVTFDSQPVCDNVAGFAALVSTYYQLYREELSDDIVFLRKFRRSPSAEEFDSVIHRLRTGAHHSTDTDAALYYEQWLSKASTPQAAADTLATLLTKALDGLAQNAVLVARDATARHDWSDVASTDVSTIMISVIEDLGLHYPPGKQRWFVRQVDGRLKIERDKRSRRAVVMEYCLQILVSQHAPLPVPYVDVLDHLGLLSDSRAEGAILVAYSVASIDPGLRGEDFLARVDKTWRAAAAY